VEEVMVPFEEGGESEKADKEKISKEAPQKEARRTKRNIVPSS
jgi:hypothetical protein